MRARRRRDPPAPPEAKILGRRIRALRDQHGWSQTKLADEADLDRAYVAGVELGLRNLALRNMVRLARALQVSLAELVGDIK